jgi:hypothetical protein
LVVVRIESAKAKFKRIAWIRAPHTTNQHAYAPFKSKLRSAPKDSRQVGWEGRHCRCAAAGSLVAWI